MFIGGTLGSISPNGLSTGVRTLPEWLVRVALVPRSRRPFYSKHRDLIAAIGVGAAFITIVIALLATGEEAKETEAERAARISGQFDHILAEAGRRGRDVEAWRGVHTDVTVDIGRE